MTKNRILGLTLCVSALSLFLFFKPIKGQEGNPDKNQILMQVLLSSLESNHYSPEQLNDSFSAHVFDIYLKRLDYAKTFLTQQDVDQLKKYRYQLDDEMRKGSFGMFDLSVSIADKRLHEVEGYYKEIISKPFDFEKDETLELDAKKVNYPKSSKELKEAWVKVLKYQALTRYDDMLNEQEKAKTDTSKKENPIKNKSAKELEEEARGKVKKVYDDMFVRMHRLERTDRFSLYMNALTNAYDPHTAYLPPRDKENFDIEMSGRLEGIGAQLQEKEGNIKVAEIVPGSASYRQGQLKAGDIILKVAQGDQEPVDVVGMRLDDVVKKVRGKKGTEVRLTVKKPNAEIVVISIIRDIVELETTYAQSDILKTEDGSRVGYIKLPGFYADFTHTGGRTSADDMRKEVEKLKAENVDGIILDLRDNGGGSLQDAIEIGGLFIDKGPIVQVKSQFGNPQVHNDTDPQTVYDGPLVIMVNRNSASASEIVAAAMQDYNRAVIVGSASSFGKGTVQRLIGLDDYLSSSYAYAKPLGSLKLTTQKFYRINGGATQLKGVVPDIIFPDPYALIDFGEKEQDYPMKWDEIAKAKYMPVQPKYNKDQVVKNSYARIDTDPNFKLVKEESEYVKAEREKSIGQLGLKKYQAEEKRKKEDNKKYDDITKEIKGLTVVNLKADESYVQSDSTRIARNKEFQKRLHKDIYLFEAVHIVSDMKQAVAGTEPKPIKKTMIDK